jgi:succinylglutamate desuccinylase
MNVKDCLGQFESLETEYPGPIPYCLKIGEGSKPSLLFTSVIHGDEVGSLPGILNAIDNLKSGVLNYNGTLYFALGNVPAMKKGVRFIADDLNRVFSRELDPSNFERNRAHQLMDLLDQVDFHMDFHQTIEPTPHSFFITRVADPKHLNIAAQLDVASFLVHASFSAATTATEYNFNQNRPSFTFELNQKGFNQEAEEKTYKTIDRLLKIMSGHSLNSSSLNILKLSYVEPLDHPMKKLKEGLQNFKKVKAGEVVGFHGDGSEIKLERDGYLLLPKYPKRDDNGQAIKPYPKNLFQFVIEK